MKSLREKLSITKLVFLLIIICLCVFTGYYVFANIEDKTGVWASKNFNMRLGKWSNNNPIYLRKVEITTQV